MAEFEEESRKSAENLAKMNKEFTKLLEGLDGTTKTLIRNASSREEQQKILKLSNRTLFEQVKGIKGNTDAEKLRRIQLLQQIRSNRQAQAGLAKMSGGFFAFAKRLPYVGQALTALEIASRAVSKVFNNTVTRSVGSMVKGFGDAENKIKGFQKLGETLFPDKGFVGKKFIAMGRAIDFNIHNFKTLAQRGADFDSSVINMRNAAASARVPLLDFVDYVGKNSDVLASLFGNVQNGVRNFETLAVRLRNLTRNEFAQFGLNFEDTNELMTTFMELERARGRAQTLTQDQLIAGTQQYTRQLIMFAKLTGESVENLDKLNRQQAVNAKFQTLLAGLAPEEASRLRAFNTILERVSPGMAQLFQETYAVGGAMNDNTAILNAMNGNALVPLFKAFIQQRASTEEVINGLRSVTNTATQTNKAFAIASLASGEFADNLRDTTSMAGALSRGLEDQMKPLKTTTGGFVGFQETLDELKSAVEKKSTEILGVTLFNEKYANEFIRNASQKISQFSLDLANFNIFSSVYDAGKKALRIIPFSIGGFMVNKTRDYFAKRKELNSRLRTSEPSEVSPDDEMLSIPQYKDGSKGFRDFGSGTPVMLHGKELVQPLNTPMGKVIASLEGAKLEQNPQKVENITNTVSNIAQGTGDFSQVVAAINGMASSLGSKADETINRLNMIAGASVKTADNTAKQIKELARNPYSIV